MVIVVMGSLLPERSRLGKALAAALGWPFVDAGSSGDDGWRQEMRALIERTLDRRDHLVIVCPALRVADRERLGGVRQVRFISLSDPPTEPLPDGDAIRFDGSQEPSTLVPLIRRELGR
jgi:hypothetical protein